MATARNTRIRQLGLALVLGLGFWAPVQAQTQDVTQNAAQSNWADTFRKIWNRGARAAEAQENIEVSIDGTGPNHNAVVLYGGCSGALIAPTLVLTAGHCVPGEVPASEIPHPDCNLMRTQSQLARHPQSAPTTWRSLIGRGPPLRVTTHRYEAKFRVGVIAVSQPRCADIALLQLARPIPASVATPLAVLTEPPLNTDRTLGTARLRYAGWGMAENLRKTHTSRQTGNVRYWGSNRCFVAGIPPLRRNGARIVSGDSGAPLLVKHGDREIVAGILWGSGTADPLSCGKIQPSPPRLHGLYTPTFREPILGTGASDIGLWLKEMAPEAEQL